MNYPYSNSSFGNVLLGLQARARMNAMRGYRDDQSGGYSSSTDQKSDSYNPLSTLSNIASKKVSPNATPWVALGLVARNMAEKDTIGGTWGKVHRALDPFTGYNSKTIAAEAWQNPLKIVDPSSGGTRVFKAIRTVFPNLPKDPSERLFNAVKKIF